MVESNDAQWYKSVLNAMHDMVIVKDAKSHLLWANQSFLDYYGMTEAELFQIVDADHSDPDDTLQYIKDDMTVVRTGRSLNIPSEAVTASNGRVRNFHTIKSPTFNDNDVTGTIAVSRLLDDTDIMKLDIDHKDAKAFVAPIRAIAASFPNPMLIIDVNNRVINTSPSWDDYFGSPNISPHSFFDDVYPELSAISAHLKNSLATNETSAGTVSINLPDQPGKAFSVKACVWHYRDGVIGGITLVATDITELHNQSTLLSKANEELTQFSYRASHDLKGPLSTAKSLAKFIRLDLEDGKIEEAHQSAAKIGTMMEKLEDAVMSFLSLAKADVKDEKDEPVDLNTVLDDICAGLAQQITAGNVRIERNIAIPHLNSQLARISQIVENLVSNGIKYAAPEKNSFVRLTAQQADNGWMDIAVEDNGQGIPPDAKEKVFDPFSRFNTKSQGTGLGLAIVKKHVDALGGFIAQKDTGDGTLFRVVLPIQELEHSP